MPEKVFGICPECGEPVYQGTEAYECLNDDCSFLLRRDTLARYGMTDLPAEAISDLLENRPALIQFRRPDGTLYTLYGVLDWRPSGHKSRQYGISLEGGTVTFPDNAPPFALWVKRDFQLYEMSKKRN